MIYDHNKKVGGNLHNTDRLSKLTTPAIPRSIQLVSLSFIEDEIVTMLSVFVATLIGTEGGS